MTKFLHFNVADQTRKMSQKLRKKYQSRTVAVDSVSADEVRKIAADYLQSSLQATVTLKVGVTYCSFKQNYCKAEGRKEALKKQAALQAVTIGIAGVVLTETHIFVQLVPYCGVQMNLRLNRNSGFSTVTGDFVGD